MTHFFLGIFNRGLAAGWVVLAVLALRLVLKKAPKWVPVLLWGLVALRLVWPFSVESPLSLLPGARPIPERVLTGPSFALQTGVGPVDTAVNGYLGDRYFEGSRRRPATAGRSWPRSASSGPSGCWRWRRMPSSPGGGCAAA